MNEILKIVRNELDGKKYLEVDATGSFVNEADNSNKSIIPGSVYGFFVSLNNTEVEELFREAQGKDTCRLNEISDFKPIIKEIYPLYWGKDKSLGARINAHIKNPKGRTGLARLCAYNSLHGKTISCIAIVVNNYSGFENHLQKTFPGLLKTKSVKL